MRFEKSITETSTEGFNCILRRVEEQIGELEERCVKNFHFEGKRKNDNTENSIRDTWDVIKWSNGSPRKRRGKGRRNI